MINHVVNQLGPEAISNIRQHLGSDPAQWDISEIGDGNVNLIFKLIGPNGRLLLKQAVPYLRCVGESWPLSLKRNYFEYKTLQFHAEFAAEYIPKVFSFDESSASMLMEFLSDHIILRKGMMSGTEYSNFAEHISDYMARTLFFTSDLALSAGKKKEIMKVYCDNTDLCKITEDLIFTDPYYKAAQNKYTPELEILVQEIHRDTALKLAATEMKSKFLTSAEALIHGDLHSGSIMVNANETKVIDPEFAFYGPMAFDPGLLLGNFLLSYFSQEGRDGSVAYENWILTQITEIWARFEHKFTRLWETDLKGDYLSKMLSENDRELMVRLRANFMENLFTDSLRFAGTEMIRRILGLAHVADLETIEDTKQRSKCEARALKMAREILVNHHLYKQIHDVVKLAREMRHKDFLT